MADFSKLPFPKRLITMDMPDKYMALCFIYDGIQYQNLCRKENPDGSFNYSANCLAELPFLPQQYLAGSSSLNASSAPGGESGLVRYDPNARSPMPPFKAFVAHYWLPILFGVLAIFLTSLIAANWLFPKFRRRNEERRMANVDENGNISLGKISFNPDNMLGMGSKGTCVYEGLFEKSQNCAIKRIVAQCLTLADREIDFLRSLQHPNLLRYLATEMDLQFIYIALELAEYTLRKVIEENKLVELDLSKEEICQQAALGLKHLHELNIVHRDIKPENILISFPRRPNNKRKVMISDFGLSKELSNFETCHSSSVMRYFDGTQGWMAPEIIQSKLEGSNLAPSRSADIFSLGCVFYYIIFDGKHPFGDVVEQRQNNILINKSFIDEFRMKNTGGDSNAGMTKELVVMGNELVRAMIESIPVNRPPISSILKFPMFWPKKDQLNFLTEVSDRMDKDKDVASRVEKGRAKVIGFDWKNGLTSALLDDLTGPTTKHRSYNEKTLKDLLRVIRNKRNHYNDCSVALKRDLGEVPDKFLDYFTSRFPELIVHVYKAMQPHKSEPKFRDFYEFQENYNF